MQSFRHSYTGYHTITGGDPKILDKDAVVFKKKRGLLGTSLRKFPVDIIASGSFVDEIYLQYATTTVLIKK